MLAAAARPPRRPHSAIQREITLRSFFVIIIVLAVPFPA
jgi:hypothetical protein